MARDEDHEASAQVRARLGELVVAYFVRAIKSLDDLPKGADLAERHVWVENPSQLPAGPAPTAR